MADPDDDVLVPTALARWLTGPPSDPSVRWRYWTEIRHLPASDRRVRSARRAIGRTGWAADVLAHQRPDGHWLTLGSSDPEIYRPKYVSTYWRFLLLADLGMTRADPRIRRMAELVIRRWTEPGTDLLGGPESELCGVGNATRALMLFGYRDHPVVRRCLDWIVRTQKGDGGWYCWPARQGSLDCWEGLAALAEIPPAARSEAVRESIRRGAEFYLKRRLMREGAVRYPPWFRIHYPTHYYYDLLVGLRVLTRLGYGRDPRLKPALRWLMRKRRADGRWEIDRDHPDLDAGKGGYLFDEGVVWPLRLEPPGQPSRWATLDALSVLDRRDSVRQSVEAAPAGRRGPLSRPGPRASRTPREPAGGR